MVGRFVEQQQVGAAHQRLRQVQPHAPAAREAATRLARLFEREAQAEQQRLGARARGVAVGVGERGVRVARCAAPSCAASASAMLASICAQRGIAVERVFERGLLGGGRLLRDVRDAPRAGRKTSPPSACSSPRSTANRLDLPEPLAPMSPVFSPGFSVNVAASKRGLMPRARLN